ncbi:hypothetical protein HY009_00075 [Candidatus Acetothermia bacterium]|nr:hypothetical protein [Candidatus Acetothermia bacterium]
MLGAIVYRRQQVRETGSGGFNQEDIRAWGNGTHPLDIERNLQCPTGIDAGEGAATVLVDFGQVAAGNAKLLFEDCQIVEDGGVIEGIHNRDRLSCAVAAEEIESVRVAQLRWIVASGRGGR